MIVMACTAGSWHACDWLEYLMTSPQNSFAQARRSRCKHNHIAVCKSVVIIYSQVPPARMLPVTRIGATACTVCPDVHLAGLQQCSLAF